MQKSCCETPTDWRAARHAAEHLLKSVYRVDMRKALDPLNDADFLVIVKQLSDQLHGTLHELEKRTVETALQALDIDLTALSPPQAAQLAKAVNMAVRNIPRQALPTLNGIVKHDLRETVNQTSVRVAAKHKWGINTSVDAVDLRMVDIVGDISSWVTDEYGRRAAMTELGIQRAIQMGMEKGLRSADIAEELQKIGHGVINRSQSYWDLVAGNLQNRARGYGNLRSMNKAGVADYRYSAVMDERTSEVCSALDGTVFPVAAGLRAYDDLQLQTAYDSEAVEKVLPFAKVRAALDGAKEIYVEPPGSSATVIARDGVTVLSPSQLAAAGVIVPPLHNKCRSTIEPVI